MIPLFSLISGRMIALLAGLLIASGAGADEAQIRKNLGERIPKFPAIDEVSKTPIPGVYEVRMGNDILYTDEDANHIFEGQIIDTRTRASLTEARVSGLSAFDFSKLPFKDTLVWKAGTGARRMVVFSDPNCGYCKRLEVDLRKLENVTIYTFLIPILGPDSVEKVHNVWCAKDRTSTWFAWMLENKVPATRGSKCDTSAIDRNIALARKHRVTGTPALVFSDNGRASGALSVAEIEKRLLAADKL